MAFVIRFNEEKNQLLKATRGIGFEDVLQYIRKKKLIDDIVHTSKKHSNQRLYIVAIHKYVYVIPYIINNEKNEIFLKTIYSSRMLTKKYLRGGKNEKKNNK